MSAPPYLPLKKPKVETIDENEVRRQQQQQQQKLVSSSSTTTTTTTKSSNMDDDDKNNNDNNSNNNSDNGVSREEQEEALVALIEHRTKEVLTNKQRIAYYKSQVLSFFILFFNNKNINTIHSFNPNFHFHFLMIFVVYMNVFSLIWL